MGKSIRAKIKKRLRTAKRQRMDAMVITPREIEKHEALVRVAQGRSVKLSRPKNAFKYPEAEDAAFPQHEVMKPIDFRASNMPMAGFVFRGNRRKYDGEQADFMKSMAKTSHPKMEILAGGGAILAKTGQKVSKREAEIHATRVNRPDMAALLEAPLNSSSAVASAVSQDASAAEPAKAGDGEDQEMEDDEDEDEDEADEVDPSNKADTSRRPVLKDARRAKRVAEHRARPNSVKKGKQQKNQKQ